MRTVSSDHYLMTSICMLPCCQMEEARELHLGVGEERQGNEDSQHRSLSYDDRPCAVRWRRLESCTWMWGRRDRAMRTVSNDHYLMTCVRVLSCCQMEETRELHLDVGEERQGNEDSQQ